MAKNKPKVRLSDVDLTMVSLVPAGDDPLAKTVLSKAARDKTVQDGGESTTLTHQHTKEHSPMAKNDDKTISKDDLPDEVVAYIDALEDTVTEQDEAITKANTERDEAVAKAAAAEAAVTVVDSSDRDAVIKAAIEKADPATAAVIKQMQDDRKADLERIEKAEATAKAERDERERRDYVSKARTEMAFINESPETLGEVLKGLHDVAPDHADKVEQLLKAANAQLEAAGIFEEIGSAGVGSDTADGALSKAVAEIRKAQPSLTPEQAADLAMQNDPSLYNSLNG